MTMPNRKRQRNYELIEPLVERLLTCHGEELAEKDNALRLNHLVHFTDDPNLAETLANHGKVKQLTELCWRTVGAQMLTAHHEAISLLVNLLVPQGTRSSIFHGFVLMVQQEESCRTLLSHEDMPVVAHHLVKAIGKCGNVEERDVLQACNLVAAAMENEKDRMDFCEAIIQAEGVSFLYHFFENWPDQFGTAALIRTLDRFLSSPVDERMWNAQTESRREFASDWLKLLTRELLQPDGALCARALGNTLQLREGTFFQVLMQGKLFDHLITNLVVGSKQGKDRICAAMFTTRQLLGRSDVLKRLASHPRFEPLVSLAISNLQLATEEEDDLLQVLTFFLQNDTTKRAVVSGSNPMQIIDAISHLLDSPSQHVQELSLELLTQILHYIEPGVLSGASEAMTRLLPRLCGLDQATDLMRRLLSSLQWWPQYVQLVPLHFKRRWLADQLHSQAQQPTPVHLQVQKDDLLGSLCNKLKDCPDNLRWGIDVSFTDDEDDEDMEEEDVSTKDRKEFFRLAANEFMYADLELFKSKDGGRSFHLSPNATEKDHVEQLELCGKLIGLALLHGEPVPSMKLSKPLRRMLLGAPLRPLEDMASVDPAFYDSKVAYILEGRYQEEGEEGSKELSALNLTFVDDAGEGEKVELCLGGADRYVNEENKMQYLDLLCHHRLMDSVRDQVEAVLNGLHTLVPADVQTQLQRVFTATELGLCLCGEGTIDVSEWKGKSEQKTSPEIWDTFWRAVEAMSNEQRQGLLEFTTGAFTVQGDVEGLILAPTDGLLPEVVPGADGSPTLKLPGYGSVEQMRQALLRSCSGSDAELATNLWK